MKEHWKIKVFRSQFLVCVRYAGRGIPSKMQGGRGAFSVVQYSTFVERHSNFE